MGLQGRLSNEMLSGTNETCNNLFNNVKVELAEKRKVLSDLTVICRLILHETALVRGLQMLEFEAVALFVTMC